MITGVMPVYADKVEGSDEGSVVHENELLQTRAGEAFSRVFCFPRAPSDPTEYNCDWRQGGVDHLFRLDFGISLDGTVKTQQMRTLATAESIDALAFYLVDDPPTLQRSRAIYRDVDNVVRIEQIAETVSGRNYILYTLEATNIGSSAVNDFKIGAYADWDVDDTSSFDFATYDASTDTAFQFENTYVGISSPTSSSAHHISSVSETINAGVVLLEPNNANALVGPGDVTVSLAWQLGKLSAGQTVSVQVILAVGADLEDLKHQIAYAKHDNNPPEAYAGLDLLVEEEDSVMLNGFGSDPDDDPLSYSWTQIGGPTVTLSAANTATPSFAAPENDDDEVEDDKALLTPEDDDDDAPTVLTFQLIVNDGIVDSEPDSVTVTVLDELEDYRGDRGDEEDDDEEEDD